MMESMIEARCKAAGIGVAELFETTKLMRDFITLSGGQPSELVVLVREALLTSGLPITPMAFQRASREGEMEYARMLRKDHWPILDEVRKGGSYTPSLETETSFRELIDSRAILQYVNAKEWYGVNPMIKNVPSPAAPKKTKKK